ncbi:MAG: alkyl hydroperoxide reductase subunit C [Tissierellia bacterium]|nr:alkyl hydroperoxide reductase subunit C [Tissierellia bacterium]
MNYINKKVEDFKVPVYHKESFSEITLEDIKSKWSVFFFYPGDFTFVCPTELEDLQNHYDKLKSLNCEVYGISTDSEFVHKAWHDHSEKISKIEFPMISDRAFNLSRQFDVLREDDGQADRATFLINPEGEIVLYEISADGIGRSAKELVRKIEASQFVSKHGDKVCPANWNSGDDTITPGIDMVGKL